MKQGKELGEVSKSAIQCLEKGVNWKTLKNIVPQEKWQRVLKDVARQVNWDEEDFGLTTLKILEKKVILGEAQMVSSLQSFLDKTFDNTWTLVGYKRSGKRILSKLSWGRKIIIGPDNDFEKMSKVDKIIFIDDDVSSGRTINLIREKIKDKQVYFVVLFDYNRTEQGLREFLGIEDLSLLFPTEFFENVRDSELLYQDYYSAYNLYSALDFDLTNRQLKFQYPDWKKQEVEIVSCDLDGTMTKLLLQKIKAKHPGVAIVVNTGRDLEGAKYYFGTCGGTDPDDIEKLDYIVASNGATIYDVKNKKTIYENTDKISGLLNTIKLMGYKGGEIVHFGDNENDLCFVENKIKTYAPSGSWLAQQEGVESYETN